MQSNTTLLLCKILTLRSTIELLVRLIQFLVINFYFLFFRFSKISSENAQKILNFALLLGGCGHSELLVPPLPSLINPVTLGSLRVSKLALNQVRVLVYYPHNAACFLFLSHSLKEYLHIQNLAGKSRNSNFVGRFHFKSFLKLVSKIFIKFRQKAISYFSNLNLL